MFLGGVKAEGGDTTTGAGDPWTRNDSMAIQRSFDPRTYYLHVHLPPQDSKGPKDEGRRNADPQTSWSIFDFHLPLQVVLPPQGLWRRWDADCISALPERVDPNHTALPEPQGVAVTPRTNVLWQFSIATIILICMVLGGNRFNQNASPKLVHDPSRNSFGTMWRGRNLFLLVLSSLVCLAASKGVIETNAHNPHFSDMETAGNVGFVQGPKVFMAKRHSVTKAMTTTTIEIPMTSRQIPGHNDGNPLPDVYNYNNSYNFHKSLPKPTWRFYYKPMSDGGMHSIFECIKEQLWILSEKARAMRAKVKEKTLLEYILSRNVPRKVPPLKQIYITSLPDVFSRNVHDAHMGMFAHSWWKAEKSDDATEFHNDEADEDSNVTTTEFQRDDHDDHDYNDTTLQPSDVTNTSNTEIDGNFTVIARGLRGAESIDPVREMIYGLQAVPSGTYANRPLISSLRDGDWLSMALAAIAVTTMPAACICHMMPGAPHGGNQGGRPGRRTHRDPPGWSPERESHYSFRNYNQDLLCWCILASDMDSAQQTAAIVQQLEGSARELARNLSYQNLTQGGLVNGQQVDPVTFLLSHLAQHFAPLGEESRLTALTELMNFHRNGHESIDSLLSRFQTLRFRATQGGNGMTMNWEGYTWLLLKACRVNHQQLLQILQPYQGRFPNNEMEFNAVQLTLRRMGHILENSHGNIASQLRTPHNNFFTDDSQQPQNDPWSTGPDPWSQAAQSSQTNQYATVPTNDNNATDAWQGWTGTTQAHQPASQTFHGSTNHDDEMTDSETSSDVGEDPDYSNAAFQGLTPSQIDEQLYWEMKTAKRNWRRHMKKPTRRVRRFVKRKGKGKGRGKSRFSFLSTMPDEEYDSMFYGGKGNSKGKRRSSGKGKGRRTNPRGRDGQIMTCGICGSETHFRAECPNNTQQQGAGAAAHSHFTFNSYSGVGPLGDLLSNEPISAMVTFEQDSIPREIPQATPTPSSQVARLIGVWTDYAAGNQHPAASDTVLTPANVAASSTDANPYANTFVQAPMPADAFVPQTSVIPPTTYMPDWAMPPLEQPVTPNLAPPTPITATPNPAITPATFTTVAVDTPMPTDNTLGLDMLGQQLRNRAVVVDQVYTAAQPQPTAQLQHAEGINLALENVPAFAMLDDFRRQHAIQSALRTEEHPAMPWEQLSVPPGLSHVAMQASTLDAQLIPQEFQNFSAALMQHQSLHSQRILTERQQRRQRLATRFAQMHNQSAAASSSHSQPDISQQQPDVDMQSTPAHTAATNDVLICSICQEAAVSGDSIATLQCQHTFHLDCVDTWVTVTLNSNTDATHATCPQCRAVLIVAARSTYTPQPHEEYSLATPRNATPAVSESNYGTPQSTASNLFLPWWPAALQYHSMTQLPDGRLSFIVDPGAWTNLVGANMARKLTQRALQAGHKPQQVPMERLNVQGVGNGSQHCNFKLQCPIAVPHADGASHLHKISTPIVEGTGADLPGLLGLRSLETDRAILDTGNKMLHYPGPGEINIQLPPGSISIPLEKAPSGHLVMPVDEYERVANKTGGTPETSLQLATIPSTTAPQSAPNGLTVLTPAGKNGCTVMTPAPNDPQRPANGTQNCHLEPNLVRSLGGRNSNDFRAPKEQMKSTANGVQSAASGTQDAPDDTPEDPSGHHFDPSGHHFDM